MGGLGLVSDFGPAFTFLQSVCSAHFFHLTSFTCGFPCAFTQVKFPLLPVCPTLVTVASFLPHIRSEKDLCESPSDAPISHLLLLVGPGETYFDFQDHHVPTQVELAVNPLTGTTFLIPFCSWRSAARG